MTKKTKDVKPIPRPEKWAEVWDKVNEKVNFHCKKFPARTGCEKCSLKKSCNKKPITWTCHHDHTALHEAMEEIGIASMAERETYIAYACAHGGYCDCEIIYNVKRGK